LSLSWSHKVTTTESRIMQNYTILLTLQEGYTPHSVGEALEAALKTLPDEPFDYSFDPMWGALASVPLKLMWGGKMIAQATIYPMDTSAEVGHVSSILDDMANDMDESEA
jgi:hypothetical protein